MGFLIYFRCNKAHLLLIKLLVIQTGSFQKNECTIEILRVDTQFVFVGWKINGNDHKRFNSLILHILNVLIQTLTECVRNKDIQIKTDILVVC